MIIHDSTYYESRRPIASLGVVNNFRRFIWDSENHTFLNRTSKEWGEK